MVQSLLMLVTPMAVAIAVEFSKESASSCTSENTVSEACDAQSSAAAPPRHHATSLSFLQLASLRGERGGISGCSDMPDVERTCSANGCKVLADNMRGRTCQQYCAQSGRACMGAWEEVNENCEVLADLHCDQTFGETSDLICECEAGLKEDIDSPALCTGMQNVEEVCSANGCKVRADLMRGRTCREYCSDSGLACVGAWEEVDEDCEAKAVMTCDQTWPGTSDLLCQCAPPGIDAPAPPPQPTAPPTQCSGLRDVEEVCSGSGCKVRAGFMTGRTCREYCGSNGLACVGAWEEVDEDCEAKVALTCDQTWPGTSDLLCECAPAGTGVRPAPPVDPPALKLVWSDDFNGSRVDTSKWSIVRRGGGFGNQELQHYTDRDANVRVEGGVLKIFAKCERFGGHSFTSAKLESKRKGDWGPGHRIEVRARLPKAKGTWPAIWMLPTNKAYGGWPKSGEIDIMEAVGCTQGKAYGTVHTGSYNHMRNTEKGGHIGTDIGAWHTYAVEWTQSEIVWYLDGRRYYSFAAPDYRDTGKWPFDQQFYLILNLAVGGTWGGWCVKPRPSCSTADQFRDAQVMEVDFARVYAL